MRLEIDMTPKTHLLQSYRLGQKPDYKALFGEAVDNSFDADASVVEIFFDNRQITISDDGRGVSPEGINALCTIGQHEELPGTRLGRYGVGVKIQAIAAGDLLIVNSIARVGGVPQRLDLKVDWEKTQHSGRWSPDVANMLPAAIDSATRTKITISKLRPIHGRRLHDLDREMQSLFYPALATGRRIVLNGQSVSALPDPVLREVIETTLNFSDGRAASVRAGIIERGDPILREIHFIQHHRCLMAGPVGDYTGLKRMYARVELIGGKAWRLAHFKNALTDPVQAAELDDALEMALLPILEACERAHETADTFEVLQALNDMLPEEWRPARPRRRKQHKPEDDDQDKRKAAKRDPGDVKEDNATEGGPARMKAQPRNRVMITFEGEQSRDGIGWVDRRKRPHRINLSGDHPFVAAARRRRDDSIALRGLFVIAMGLYEESSSTMLRDFGQRWAALLALQSTEKDLQESA
jgi:hypothetical protein